MTLVNSLRREFGSKVLPARNFPLLGVQLFSVQPRRSTSVSVRIAERYCSNKAKISRTRSDSDSFIRSLPPAGSTSYPKTGHPPNHFPLRREADILSRA